MCSRSKQNLLSGGNGMISEFGTYFYITFSSPLPSFPEFILFLFHLFLNDKMLGLLYFTFLIQAVKCLPS
jgi:hypothetical protein